MATRSWNRVELIGNLTKDPELRYTPQGTAVATFTIATNRTYMSDGEKKEEADFHRCVAWAKLAELCSQLMKKGNRVFVSGRLQNRSWEDQTTHQNRQMTEIVVEDMLLLTSRNGSSDFVAEDVSVESSTRQEPAETVMDEPKTDVTTPEPEVAPAETPEEPPKKDESSQKETIDDKELEDLPF